MIRQIAHWLGPQSPLGSFWSGFITVGIMAVAILVAFPPVVWLMRQIVGSWWSYWLGA